MPRLIRLTLTIPLGKSLHICNGQIIMLPQMFVSSLFVCACVCFGACVFGRPSVVFFYCFFFCRLGRAPFQRVSGSSQQTRVDALLFVSRASFAWCQQPHMDQCSLRNAKDGYKMTPNLAVLHCKTTTVILHQIHSSKLCFYSPRHNLQGKYSILT